MSGFAGIVRADGQTPDAKLLERFAEQLAFRGPDATQIWTRPGAGFCFTLLRTGPAPQAETQPCSLDGRVWLLGDVRLDGRDDLRRELEPFGECATDSATDEEFVLGVWRQWGEEGLAKLLGDFSFVLWDAVARELRCVRDLIGARPFFYARSSDWFCFSNTLEVVRSFPGVSSALDPQFIGDFLINESSLDAWRTVYRDITRLSPGHFLSYSSEGLRVRRYTEFPIEEPLWLKRPSDYIERFQELLEQAVADRLPHAPSAIFLSGGLDSTSVAATACKIARQNGALDRPRAYTIDCSTMFKDEEGALASHVAKQLDMEIEILSGASCLPYEGWGNSHGRTSEPYHDPFAALGLRQWEQVRHHARVAFSGYGGDDILTGQAWPHLIYLLKHRSFLAIAKTFGSYVLAHRRIPPLRAGIKVRLRKWFGYKNPLTEFPQWLKPNFSDQQNLRDRWRETPESPESIHPLHPIAHSGLSSDFWASVFEGDDAGVTGVGVDSRAPLLDGRLLRFLLRVPPVPWCMEKTLLREAMRGMLPEEVRRRPKVPLLGDSVRYFVESKQWSPLPLPTPAAGVLEFVDWECLRATLESAQGSSLWVALRPVSLSYWLKGVVNGGRIGYSFEGR